MKVAKDEITFSFGENWKEYIRDADDHAIKSAREDILKWIPEDKIKGKRIVDIGCGSGIHSLSFFRLGASEVISIDYDKASVEATQYLWDKEKQPSSWKISHGSALDKEFMQNLGHFDVMYSWGVLHHTGNMWGAIENVLPLTNPGGLCWISLYVAGPNFERDVDRKKRYNKSGELGKRWMEFRYFIFPLMYNLIRRGKNPFSWNRTQERGMNTYYDIKDWLGGLPYEVASKEEVTQKFEASGYSLIKIQEYPEGSCHVYLFQKNT
jgi:SAM-dependent methyltransferase